MKILDGGGGRGERGEDGHFYLKSIAPAENRTRGPTMATLDFTTKPLAHITRNGNRTHDLSCVKAAS